MNVSKGWDIMITEGFENLKASEGVKAGYCIVNVRTSVGVRTFMIATLMILALVQAAQAGDWPMFRHDIIHTGVTDEAVEPPLEMLWKYQTGNLIESSPVVSVGVVYFGSRDKYTYAVDATTGSLIWKFQTGNWISSSPAVYGGIVYIGSDNNNIYALDAATGSLKWKFQTGNWISSSPAVYGGVVYIGSSDNYLYALDASTGSLKWKYQTGVVGSSPAVSGGVVYVGSWNNQIYALDATTGSLKWQYQTGNGVVSSLESSPSVSGGVVYIGSHDNYTYALDASTGSLKWNYKTDGSVYSSPAVSGGIVYIGSSDNYIYALDASTGSLKWKYNTNGYIWSSPTVSGSVVYIGSDNNNIYALDASTGSLKWKYNAGGYNTGGAIISSPTVSGGVIYVGSGDGSLYAFNEVPIVTAITVSPTTASVAVDSTQTFTATPKDKFGKTMTAAVIWSSSNMTVGTIDSNGLFTAKAPGTTTVTAANGTVIETASVTVLAPTPAPATPAPATPAPATPTSTPPLIPQTVIVASEPASIEVDQTSVVKVTVTGTDDKPISGATVMLSASAGKVSPALGITDINGQFNSTFVGSAEGKVIVSALVRKEGFIDGKGEGNLVIEIGQSMTPTITPNQTPNQMIAPTTSPVSTSLGSADQPDRPWYWILILLIPISGGLAYAKFKKKREDLKPEGKPAQESTTFTKAAVIDTHEKSLTKKPEAEPKIDIKSAYEYNCAKIFYKVKLENNTSETIGDIKVNLFVPDVFLLKEKEKSISMLEPKESKTVTFEIRPTGECGDCNVSGKIEYYNYNIKGREMLDIGTKTVSVICPVLKRKEIDTKQWEPVTDELIKAEEDIKELSVPAENLFNITSRVIKDNGMFMLKPEITSTPQLFEGFARFYAEGVKGLRYAAYIEVVGGVHKSRLILKAWAEKEEALIGFYHRLLDGIEKRIDVKIFIDDPIMRIHIDHFGDNIGMDKKIVKGGTGITAGGDVNFSDVTGQVAIGKNIAQTYILSPLDKKELRDCLVQFQKEINKLSLPANTLNTVNGDVAAAITEVEKEKPDPSKIKNRFQGALDKMKDMGDTIEKVSKWTWTEKVIKILGKLGLSILL